MSAGRKRTPKRVIAGIIAAAVVTVFVASLFICNLFLPVKYLFAYMNFVEDKPSAGQMRVRFLDIYEGDCTFVEFPDGTNLLIDGGTDTYTGRLKIFKTLKGSGVSRIDCIISTSCNASRSGGLAEVTNYFEVGKIYAPQHNSATTTKQYENFMAQARERGVPVENASYGAGFSGENYSCVILNSRTYADPSDWTLNAVVHISCYGTDFLLLGGCDAGELRDFYTAYTAKPQDGVTPDLNGVEIVKAASGGGVTFTPLIDLLRPETAIISGDGIIADCWSDLQNYAHGGIFRTDLDGTVTVCVTSAGYEVQKEK